MIKVGMIVGDRYEILEKIGVGGMAEVFRGRDHKLNRFVAVKVLKEEYRDNRGFIKKFKEEAQAAAGLAHPNIVNVYDVGDENGIYYIVMELVEGITLKKYIERKGRLTVKEATSIAIQVSAGLEVAHNNQIAHRDIKPQNIMISREGKVKVTDFRPPHPLPWGRCTMHLRNRREADMWITEAISIPWESCSMRWSPEGCPLTEIRRSRWR